MQDSRTEGEYPNYSTYLRKTVTKTTKQSKKKQTGYSRMNLAVVELCVHDDDKVGEDVESPAEVTRNHGNLHSSRIEQLFYKAVITPAETFVNVGHPLRQCLLQSLDTPQDWNHKPIEC